MIYFHQPLLVSFLPFLTLLNEDSKNKLKQWKENYTQTHTHAHTQCWISFFVLEEMKYVKEFFSGKHTIFLVGMRPLENNCKFAFEKLGLTLIMRGWRKDLKNCLLDLLERNLGDSSKVVFSMWSKKTGLKVTLSKKGSSCFSAGSCVGSGCHWSGY